MKPARLDPTDLQALLDSCRRNRRPARFPTPGEKIYFDADRFRWWLNHGIKVPGLMAEFQANSEKQWPIQKWRDWIDKEIEQWHARNPG